MESSQSLRTQDEPRLPFFLLCALLVALWVGGGASHIDALGQAVVRGTSWFLLLIATLLGNRRWIRSALSAGRLPLILLLAALMLALLQLVPLPPVLWQALPGRGQFAEAAAAIGQTQPWRPWSIVPDATLNSASSLIVPFTAMIFSLGISADDRRRLLGVLVALVAAMAFAGVLQFSGADLTDVLVNNSQGVVSGTFANRNHFALFLSVGCVLVLAWGVLEKRSPAWRGLLATGLVIVFTVTVIATGSRAGILLVALALVAGALIVRRSVSDRLRRYPYLVGTVIVLAVLGLISVVFLLTFDADRAMAFKRVLANNDGDMRSRSLPVVIKMIKEYLPLGSGLGAFDATFRMHETFTLLKPTYLNHAHDDYLELVLDAGLPGLFIMLSAVAWWAFASLRAWRAEHALPKLGSATLFLIAVASGFDYPARTPMIMALIALAAGWLSSEAPVKARVALSSRRGQKKHIA